MIKTLELKAILISQKHHFYCSKTPFLIRAAFGQTMNTANAGI